MHYSYLPQVEVDLQADAVSLAQRLGSKIDFLEAAYELETCRYASSFYFRRHSRKIITLIEISRKTILMLGVRPYPFMTCASHLSRYKSAYIHLLQMIDFRKQDVDPAMQARAKSLLFPLYAEAQVAREGVLLSGYSTCSSSGVQHHVPATFSSIVNSVDFESLKMPPPEFPPTRNTEKERKLPRQNIYGENDEISMLRQGGAEEFADVPRLVKPLQGRFGIFCTPKSSSMHTYQPSASY